MRASAALVTSNVFLVGRLSSSAGLISQRTRRPYNVRISSRLLLCKLGPDGCPVIGAKIRAPHPTLHCSLDCCALIDWNATLDPIAEALRRDAKA